MKTDFIVDDTSNAHNMLPYFINILLSTKQNDKLVVY